MAPNAEPLFRLAEAQKIYAVNFIYTLVTVFTL